MTHTLCGTQILLTFTETHMVSAVTAPPMPAPTVAPSHIEIWGVRWASSLWVLNPAPLLSLSLPALPDPATHIPTLRPEGGGRKMSTVILIPVQAAWTQLPIIATDPTCEGQWVVAEGIQVRK
uniref:Uncharacterized protein n=1 Tax=Colobus angolensis palliatus TaxID=336983 RepID=A0A2K5H747_COLAP